jgi:flagellar motor switch protein FliG
LATTADIRKAALLLMGLEPTTAAELLKAAKPEVVTRIAAELAYLQATGEAGKNASREPVREFLEQLREAAGDARGGRFIQTMLEGVLGSDRAREIMARISDMVDRRDPFLPIRSAEPADIAEALAGESAAVAGLVLAELPPKVSGKLLPLLDEDIRADAVRSMTSEKGPAMETRMRVATVVRKRLTDKQGAGGGEAAGRVSRDEQLRKVALLLRGLGSELRGTLLEALTETDEEASRQIQELMVVWTDIPAVSDRSCQEGLRSIDSRKLAVALVDADETTLEKLRGNMSQRQLAMLDEEASLLSQPSEAEIAEARGELLSALRELAANNFLTFEGD